MIFNRDFDGSYNAANRLAWFDTRGLPIPKRVPGVYRFSARVGRSDRVLYIGKSKDVSMRVDAHQRWTMPLSLLSGVRVDVSVLELFHRGLIRERVAIAQAETEAHQTFAPILESSVSVHLFPDHRERIAVVSAMLRHDLANSDRYGQTDFDLAFDAFASFADRREVIGMAIKRLRADIDWTLRWCENPNSGDKPEGFHRMTNRPRVDIRRNPKKDEGNGVGRGEA